MAVPSFVGSTSVVGITQSSLSLPHVANTYTVNVGDLLLIVTGSDINNPGTNTWETTTPTGYTQLMASSDNAEDVCVNVFWKVAVTADTTAQTPGNISLTFGNAADVAAAHLVISGAHGTTPIYTTANTRSDSAGTTANFSPSVAATNTNDSLCLVAYVFDGADGTMTVSGTGWAEAVQEVEVNPGSGNSATIGVVEADQATAGTPATPTISSGTSDGWHAVYFVVEPGATAYTLTADVGAYTLAGVAADTYLNRKLTADVGSYTLSGIAANTQLNRTLLAEVGSYTLAGQAASLAYDDGSVSVYLPIPEARLENPALFTIKHHPNFPVEVDWDNPLTKGLVGALIMNEAAGKAHNLAGPQVATLSNGADWDRLGIDTNTATSYFALNKPVTVSLDHWAYLQVMKKGGVVGSNPGIWRGGASSNVNTFVAEDGTYGTPWIRHNGTDLIRPASGATQPTDGCMIYQVGVGASEVWIDGKKEHTGSGGGSPGTTVDIYNIGYQFDTGQRVYGVWKFVAWWTRSLTPDEARSLTLNPYQFLVPR